MNTLLRRTNSIYSNGVKCLRSRTRSTIVSGAVSFAVLGLVGGTPSVTFGTELAAPVARAAAPRVILPACTNDANGKASLQGTLRTAHASAHLTSVVQFFPSSDETEYYVGSLESQLSGRSLASSSQQASNSQSIADAVRHMQGLPQLISSAKLTMVDANGAFSCAGFLPGNYVLLGTLLGDSNQRGTRVRSYWRADVIIPTPNDRRSYVVPAFRFLGQVSLP